MTMSCCLTTVTPSPGQDMTRTSRFFVRPPPFIGPPIEPPSSHPHTLTPSQEGSHWVSFHFQQSRDELVWVTVVSKATIFLALCLHSAVDELLRQRSNKPIRKPSENVSKVGTHCFLENSVSHESKDCVYDPNDMLLLQPLCPLTLHQEERRVGVLGRV